MGNIHGQLPQRDFALPHATAYTLEVWEDARKAAREFWGKGGEDVRLSDDARLFYTTNVRLFG